MLATALRTLLLATAAAAISVDPATGVDEPGCEVCATLEFALAQNAAAVTATGAHTVAGPVNATRVALSGRATVTCSENGTLAALESFALSGGAALRGCALEAPVVSLEDVSLGDGALVSAGEALHVRNASFAGDARVVAAGAVAVDGMAVRGATEPALTVTVASSTDDVVVNDVLVEDCALAATAALHIGDDSGATVVRVSNATVRGVTGVTGALLYVAAAAEVWIEDVSVADATVTTGAVFSGAAAALDLRRLELSAVTCEWGCGAYVSASTSVAVADVALADSWANYGGVVAAAPSTAYTATDIALENVGCWYGCGVYTWGAAPLTMLRVAATGLGAYDGGLAYAYLPSAAIVGEELSVAASACSLGACWVGVYGGSAPELRLTDATLADVTCAWGCGVKLTDATAGIAMAFDTVTLSGVDASDDGTLVYTEDVATAVELRGLTAADVTGGSLAALSAAGCSVDAADVVLTDVTNVANYYSGDGSSRLHNASLAGLTNNAAFWGSATLLDVGDTSTDVSLASGPLYDVTLARVHVTGSWALLWAEDAPIVASLTDIVSDGAGASFAWVVDDASWASAVTVTVERALVRSSSNYGVLVWGGAVNVAVSDVVCADCHGLVSLTYASYTALDVRSVAIVDTSQPDVYGGVAVLEWCWGAVSVDIDDVVLSNVEYLRGLVLHDSVYYIASNSRVGHVNATGVTGSLVATAWNAAGSVIAVADVNMTDSAGNEGNLVVVQNMFGANALTVDRVSATRVTTEEMGGLIYVDGDNYALDLAVADVALADSTADYGNLVALHDVFGALALTVDRVTATQMHTGQMGGLVFLDDPTGATVDVAVRDVQLSQSYVRYGGVLAIRDHADGTLALTVARVNATDFDCNNYGAIMYVDGSTSSSAMHVDVSHVAAARGEASAGIVLFLQNAASTDIAMHNVSTADVATTLSSRPATHVQLYKPGVAVVTLAADCTSAVTLPLLGTYHCSEGTTVRVAGLGEVLGSLMHVESSLVYMEASGLSVSGSQLVTQKGSDKGVCEYSFANVAVAGASLLALQPYVGQDNDVFVRLTDSRLEDSTAFESVETTNYYLDAAMRLAAANVSLSGSSAALMEATGVEAVSVDARDVQSSTATLVATTTVDVVNVTVDGCAGGSVLVGSGGGRYAVDLHRVHTDDTAVALSGGALSAAVAMRDSSAATLVHSNGAIVSVAAGDAVAASAAAVEIEGGGSGNVTLRDGVCDGLLLSAADAPDVSVVAVNASLPAGVELASCDGARVDLVDVADGGLVAVVGQSTGVSVRAQAVGALRLNLEGATGAALALTDVGQGELTVTKASANVTAALTDSYFALVTLSASSGVLLTGDAELGVVEAAECAAVTVVAAEIGELVLQESSSLSVEAVGAVRVATMLSTTGLVITAGSGPLDLSSTLSEVEVLVQGGTGDVSVGASASAMTVTVADIAGAAVDVATYSGTRTALWLRNASVTEGVRVLFAGAEGNVTVDGGSALTGGGVELPAGGALVVEDSAVADVSMALDGAATAVFRAAALDDVELELLGASTAVWDGVQASGVALSAADDSSAAVEASRLTGSDVSATASRLALRQSTLADCTVAVAASNASLADSELVASPLVATAGSSVGAERSNFTGAAVDGDGGAIAIYGGSLVLRQARVAGCRSSGDGGGVYAADGARLTIVETELSGNVAGGTGGGLCVAAGAELVIADSKLSGNNASYGGGLGLLLDGDCASVDVAASVEVTGDNAAGVRGGGAYFGSGGACALNASLPADGVATAPAALAAVNVSADAVVSGGPLSLRVVLLDDLGAEVTDVPAADVVLVAESDTLALSGELVARGLSLALSSVAGPHGETGAVVVRAASPANVAPLSVPVEMLACALGEVAVGDSQACAACPPGQLAVSAGAARCQECPRNALCAGGAHLVPVSGFARVSAAEVQLCPKAGGCRGAPAGAAHVGAAAYDEGCAEGYTGTLCSVCADGYSSSFQDCVACPASPELVVAATAALVVVAVCVVLRLSARLGRGGGAVKLVVTAVQSASATLAFDLEWPPGLAQAGAWLNVANADLRAVAPLSCVGSLSFYSLWVAGALFLPAVALLNAAVRGRRTNVTRDSLVLGVLLFPGSVGQTLSFFRCVDVDGDRYLLADMRVRCESDEHLSWAPLAAALLLGYVAAALAAMRQLHRLRHRLAEPAVRATWGVLYGSYRPEHYMHEFAVVTLKTSLWSATLLGAWQPVQVAVGTLLVGGFCVVHVSCHPFRTRLRNWIGAAVYVLIFSLNGHGLVLAMERVATYSEADVEAAQGVVLFFLSVAVLAGVVRRCRRSPARAPPKKAVVGVVPSFAVSAGAQ